MAVTLGAQKSMFSLLQPAATIQLRRQKCQASLHTPIDDPTRKSVYIPKVPIPSIINMEELVLREDHDGKAATSSSTSNVISDRNKSMLITTKLYAIAEAVADRAEMHSIIGEQRNNWNSLLLNSINSITLTASLMAGIASIPAFGGEDILPLKVSSVILFTAAAGMMAAVNKIQPSQLAEEQRNATRLFKQLERSIHTTLALSSSNPTESDVEEALERINAIERAYPLPLLPLPDKFPKVLKPTAWWPKKLKTNQNQQQKKRIDDDNNGWSEELEEEMVGILRVLKTKDQEHYKTCGDLVTKINRTLAVSGPILASIAAIGTGLIGSSTVHDPWPALIGVAAGALATVVNTLEHGGQMGMVFELFRNCAGYYVRLDEEIENNLGETDVQKREDGELFRMKMALHLGRSLSELEGFASYASAASCQNDDIKEFAGKLF